MEWKEREKLQSYDQNINEDKYITPISTWKSTSKLMSHAGKQTSFNFDKQTLNLMRMTFKLRQVILNLSLIPGKRTLAFGSVDTG